MERVMLRALSRSKAYRELLNRVIVSRPYSSYHPDKQSHLFNRNGRHFPHPSYSGIYNYPFTLGAHVRYFTSGTSQMPVITDPVVKDAFKDLMAASWNELPPVLIYDVEKAISKPSEDKTGQEALRKVFIAAEAVEEFGGALVTLRRTLDDLTGLSGDIVQPLPDDLDEALTIVYNRYMAYLNAFDPEEAYLRRKVEVELGTKMVHLKMRVSGLDAEWGNISVLGTTGLAGSYIEQRS